jgi:hypothetical protein
MEEINKVSNPHIVLELLHEYYGKDKELLISTRKNKKYMVKNNNKYIHFGDIRFEDFTKHNDLERRTNYLKRSSKIKGEWTKDIYSPNMLSIILLWNGYKYLKDNNII